MNLINARLGRVSYQPSGPVGTLRAVRGASAVGCIHGAFAFNSGRQGPPGFLLSNGT
jgi:hypothetical protein